MCVLQVIHISSPTSQSRARDLQSWRSAGTQTRRRVVPKTLSHGTERALRCKCRGTSARNPAARLPMPFGAGLRPSLAVLRIFLERPKTCQRVRRSPLAAPRLRPTCSPGHCQTHTPALSRKTQVVLLGPSPPRAPACCPLPSTHAASWLHWMACTGSCKAPAHMLSRPLPNPHSCPHPTSLQGLPTTSPWRARRSSSPPDQRLLTSAWRLAPGASGAC
jgi:hypothetical protein